MVKKILSDKLKPFLRQGMTPQGLAISTSAGIIIGLFPILGIATWVITLAALRFRLNLAVMITSSYLVWPLQVLLIIPFLRLGEWMWQVPAFPLSIEKIQSSFQAGFLSALTEFWEANLCTASGWMVVALPAGLLLYTTLIPVFKYLLPRLSPEMEKVRSDARLPETGP